jgi:hypothetical protein
MESNKEVSMIEIGGGSYDPIGTMRKFVNQHKNRNYIDFDMEALANVFSDFLNELDSTDLSGKNRKRELGKLFVKHFEGKIKEQQNNLPYDVRIRIEIDAVIYYKFYFEKGESANLKKKIVDLIFTKYRIPSFSIKTFENWYTQWSEHVDEIFNEPQSKDFHVRQMQSRLEDRIITTKRLSNKEKENSIK